MAEVPGRRPVQDAPRRRADTVHVGDHAGSARRPAGSAEQAGTVDVPATVTAWRPRGGVADVR
ncbi:hypothetical protein [Pseudonocardia tropica]|uniref:hypothetical protein n=1 Tax=Pseudonocardia tropica TaxID=681289 RepID=UPI0031E5EAB9